MSISKKATGLLVLEAINSNLNGDPDRESALAYYGGFNLHYYIPGTVNGKPAWVLNPADKNVSSEGISAMQYVNGVRSKTVPN